MRLKTVTDDKGFTFTFGERGQPIRGRPSILFLHGFSADHFMWAPIVQVGSSCDTLPPGVGARLVDFSWYDCVRFLFCVLSDCFLRV